MARVTTIPATISRFTAAPINEKKKRRTAAYARVSTDSEEQLTSYAAQVDYDGLTARYDTAKARYDEVNAAISDKQARQAQIEAFLETLRAQDGLVEKFEVSLWCGLVDFITVYAKDDVRFTFKHGGEIRA